MKLSELFAVFDKETKKNPAERHMALWVSNGAEISTAEKRYMVWFIDFDGSRASVRDLRGNSNSVETIYGAEWEVSKVFVFPISSAIDIVIEKR